MKFHIIEDGDVAWLLIDNRVHIEDGAVGSNAVGARGAEVDGPALLSCIAKDAFFSCDEDITMSVIAYLCKSQVGLCFKNVKRDLRCISEVPVSESKEAVFAVEGSGMINGLEKDLIDYMSEAWRTVPTAETCIRIGYMGFKIWAFQIIAVPAYRKQNLEMKFSWTIDIQKSLVRKIVMR